MSTKGSGFAAGRMTAGVTVGPHLLRLDLNQADAVVLEFSLIRLLGTKQPHMKDNDQLRCHCISELPWLTGQLAAQPFQML